MTPASSRAPTIARQVTRPQRRRPGQAVQPLDREVQQRDLQQLVVERWHAGPVQHGVQRHRTQTVAHPEQHPSHLGPRCGRWVGEQEVHTEKDRDRDIRVVKKIDAGDAEIEEPEHIGDNDRGHRHRRHSEEILSGERDKKQHQIDVRGEKLGRGDVLTPGEIAGAGENQRQREDREWKRRRVEDVNALSVLVPPDQLLGGEPEPDQQKLQIEPVVGEPQEEVNAEDDGERPEPQGVRVPSRPAQQHVERVREDQLGGDEKCGVVNRTPVPPPVDQEGELRERLHEVLRPNRHLERQWSTRAVGRPEDQATPDEQQDAGTNKRPLKRGVLSDPVQQTERAESQREDRHQTAAAHRRDADHLWDRFARHAES